MSDYAFTRERTAHAVELARYAAAEVRSLKAQLAEISTPCNTERLRELFEAYDIPADVQDRAIKDCEGKLPTHADLVIKILESQYPKKPRHAVPPKPADIIREMHEIGPQMIERHARYAMRGIHKSSAELRAEIAAEAAR